jgi:hypothetical protein
LKEERKTLHTIKTRKIKWIGHILRGNCVIEGKVEERIKVTGRRGKRRKQLLDGLKETIDYWKLKEEALDCTLWRTRLGRGYGTVVRQTGK